MVCPHHIREKGRRNNPPADRPQRATGQMARDGTGYDAIDLNAATECGILVTRAPVLHHATANTTIGLMIALVRKISLADRGIREGLLLGMMATDRAPAP